MDWTGRTAIVTGASGGIGSAICRKLASMQINQLITGRKQEILDSLAAELSESGVEVIACVAVILRIAHLSEACRNVHWTGLAV